MININYNHKPDHTELFIFGNESERIMLIDSIKEIIKLRNNSTKEDSLIYDICKYYGVSVEKVLSKSRKKELKEIRQIICFFYKKYTDMKLTQIGKILNYNHSTVLYSIGKIKSYIQIWDKQVCLEIANLTKYLGYDNR